MTGFGRLGVWPDYVIVPSHVTVIVHIVFSQCKVFACNFMYVKF